jgi:ABC-2 type transport system ATP-binding protein
MIEVEGLSKVFRVHQKQPGFKASLASLFKRQWLDKVAVEDASFEVHEGEIVGLIGANGAGKTTLVKMLSGIIHPTSGHARVLGHVPWERNDDLRRQLALIMGQKAQLWWDLPAADSFELLREIYGIKRTQFDENLERLTELLKVKEELCIQIRRLSLGERMKMEVIAALLHSPRIVFLDEPTIGLDITTQRAIRDFILAYRNEHRPAMLLTSHYMEDIERLCERIIILREGRIVYDGSLKRVIEDYAPHKILTVHFRPETQSNLNPDTLAKMGKLLRQSKSELSLEVKREKVPEVASAILGRAPVIDLSIDEVDIGTIIEGLMEGGEGGP